MEREAYLEQLFSEAGLSLSPEKCAAFLKYYELLVEKNAVMNLTTITGFEEVALKHFADSCMLFSLEFHETVKTLGLSFHENTTLIDVGTGAGFPGLPLKIYCPSLEVVLMDALQKRVGFLQEVIGGLKLEGIEAVHARAEEGVSLLWKEQPLREHCTVAVSRAVAGLPVLLEYCLPFVEEGGCFIAYKSSEVEEELHSAGNALKILGGEIAEVKKFELPRGGGGRSLIFIRKVAETPAKYPRKAGKPGKSPL